MTLAFEFIYQSSNNILASIIDRISENKIKYCIIKEKGKITLYASGKPNELEEFANTLSLRIPHSIFIANLKVFEVENMPQSNYKPDKYNLSNITPMQIQNYQNKSITENEFNILSNIIFKDTQIKKENFNQALQSCKEILKTHEKLLLKNNDLEFELSIFKNDFNNIDAIVPTNLKALPKIFIADEKTLFALASFEKPIICLRTSAIYRSNHENAPLYFNTKAPKDLFVYALCDSLYNDGINFIGIKYNSKYEPFCVTVLDQRYIITSGTSYLDINDKNFIYKNDNKNFALHALCEYELKQEKTQNVLRIFCSKNFTDEIEIIKNKDAIKALFIPTFDNFNQIYEGIKSLDGGDRLLQNYQKEFKLIYEDLNLKSNFFGLFCIIGRILDLDNDTYKAGERLIEFANDFGGTKGVRVEFKMSNKNEFDILKAIRSAMSFRLAGVGEKNLSFGVCESFAYFIDDFIRFSKEEYNTDLCIATGSLFSNKTISKLVLNHAKVLISTELPLESRV